VEGEGEMGWVVLFSSVECVDKGRLDGSFARGLEAVALSLLSSKRAK
jgi:hypothetical protein